MKDNAKEKIFIVVLIVCCILFASLGFYLGYIYEKPESKVNSNADVNDSKTNIDEDIKQVSHIGRYGYKVTIHHDRVMMKNIVKNYI